MGRKLGDESVEGYVGGEGRTSTESPAHFFFMDKIHLRLLESSPSTSTEG